jgi:hypothetical protein
MIHFVSVFEKVPQKYRARFGSQNEPQSRGGAGGEIEPA